MTQHSKVRMFRNISTSQTIYKVKTKLSLHVLGFCSTYFEVANERVASNQIVNCVRTKISGISTAKKK